ncbi:MAG: hypothetical protein JWO78_2362 [Micavibrio sp.]|nr:hypothetical protein [Micavibrio sp.]
MIEVNSFPKHHFIEDLIKEVTPIVEAFLLCIKGLSTSYEEVREIRLNEGMGFVKTLVCGFSKVET